MMQHIARYWWVGGLLSLAYTAFSIWWTVRANKKFDKLTKQADATEEYLGDAPTWKMKKADPWHP